MIFTSDTRTSTPSSERLYDNYFIAPSRRRGPSSAIWIQEASERGATSIPTGRDSGSCAGLPGSSDASGEAIPGVPRASNTYNARLSLLISYRTALQRAEARFADGACSLEQSLQDIPLDVVGVLYLQRDPEYPALTAALPALPSAEVQVAWTSTHGHTLMMQSCVFVKTAVSWYEKITGRNMADATVLDYGCGWGRLARLMLRYTSADRIWALDPWDVSIKACRDAALPVHVARCDAMPFALPVGETQFDFAFAFSVFTHLSEECAATVLKTLHRYMRPNGVLAITIRPIDYWLAHSTFPANATRETLVRQHEATGFAFLPGNLPPIGEDVTYGDTSMSFEYIDQHFTDWSIAGTDLNLVDPLQIIVYMVPRK